MRSLVLAVAVVSTLSLSAAAPSQLAGRIDSRVPAAEGPPLQDAPSPNQGSTRQPTATIDRDQCVWVFHSYEPSAWENEWRRAEESGERRDKECEVLAQPEEVRRSVLLITAIGDLARRGKSVVPPESIALFSRMVYARRCGANLKDTGQRRVQLIEPLIGILRDPLTICPKPAGVDEKIYSSFGPDEDAVQSKRSLLLGPLAPWSDTPKDPKSWRVGGFDPGTSAAARRQPRARQKVLMDLGASLYDRWVSDTASVGALWFVEQFRRRKLAWDWIVSFEIQKFDPDEIYKSVPDDVLPHYVYFNKGVEATPNGRWNPWRILRGMGVTPDDYVVVKLDIDVMKIETALVNQLVESESLRRLVDEVFFEHHVNVKAMWEHWGKLDPSVTTKDSYRLFTKLRSDGVRMHSWP